MLIIKEFDDGYIDEISSFFNNERELYYSFPRTNFPLSKEDFKNAIIKRVDYTTVFCDNRLAGFADLYDIIENEECNIGNVIINPNLRKKGIGLFLIEQLIQKAINHYKIKKICLYCWCENSIGLLFYHKIGFKPLEIVEFNKKGKRIPILKMFKTV